MDGVGENGARPTRDPRLQMLRQADHDVQAASERLKRLGKEAARQGMETGEDGREVAAWGQRKAAADRRMSALRDLGMPESIVEKENGNYAHTGGDHSGVRGGLRLPGRERLIFARRDDQGRLHAEDGPAGVTNRGTMLFMREGRFAPGRDGFCAVTADGCAYRGPEHAAGRFGRVAEVEAPKKAHAPKRREAEPEL